jgi:hypothetical protein
VPTPTFVKLEFTRCPYVAGFAALGKGASGRGVLRKVVIWIAGHWVELILLLGVLIVIGELKYISRSINGVLLASTENINATRSVEAKVAEIAFELTKITNELSPQGHQSQRELEAIGRNIKDISEVIVYGREWRDRRLSVEREARVADYERRLAEIREKADAGDVQAQGYYAQDWAMREDYVQAHIWYTIATARAPAPWQYGLEKRDQIATKMTPEQLAEAERKARNWLDAHPASPTLDGQSAARS